MITQISNPVWNPSKRMWVITYTVQDKIIGEYIQVVETETLLSAENYANFIKGRIK